MKDFRYPPYLKYLQFILLLAVVLFNFAPISTFPVYAVAPVNDAWQNATDVPSIPFSDTVDTTDANQELDEPQLGPEEDKLCNGVPLRAGLTTVWYTYTAPVSAWISMDTLGSNQPVINPSSGLPYEYDTYIAVYTGTPSGDPTLVACNDDNPAGYRSQVNFVAISGTTYYVQVAQYNGRLDRTFVEQPYQGGTLQFHVGYAAFPASWVGGISIISDKNVVAVGRPHIGSEVASYDSFTGGSLTAYVPMLFKDAFGGSYDSALYVQNVHANNTANITIKYYDSAGNLSCTKFDTLASLSSKGYWVPSETCLPVGWVGGAVVTSNQPIVAVGRPHIGAEVMTYDGFTTGDLSMYIPMLFKDGFGGSYDSAFYIQNVHASNTANVTIKYYDSTGVLRCTKADTIASLASKGYWVPSATCDTGSLPVGWVGGVLVTSDQPIVGVGRPHIGAQVTTYNGFAGGSLNAYIPMLFKDGFGGSYDSAFYVQNVHASNTANVTIKYYDSTGVLRCTKADTIAPLGSKGYWVPSATCDTGSLPVGWVGGVLVTSDQPIVGVGRPHIGAQVTTYNSFTGGTLNAYIPMLFKAAFGGTYNAAFYIQNTEASAATVTVKFYDSDGTLSCIRNDTIPALSTLGYWVPSITCNP